MVEGDITPKIKVVVNNNTESIADKAAQRVVLNYLTSLNISGKNKFIDFLKKSNQKGNDYEAIFYLNKYYHPNNSDKYYPNKLIYRKTIDEAYNDALSSDDESPSFIRLIFRDNVANFVAVTEFALFGGYIGDMYDDKGYLKQEVKDAAIASLKKKLFIEKYDTNMRDGGKLSNEENNEIFNQREKEGKAHRILKKEGDIDFVELGKAAIIINQSEKGIPVKDLRAEVKAFLINNVSDGYVINKHTNHKIYFTSKSIKKLLNETSEEKLITLYHIKEIVENATPESVEEINRTQHDIQIKKESDFLYNFEYIIMIDSKWYQYWFKTFVRLSKEKNNIEQVFIYSTTNFV